MNALVPRATVDSIVAQRNRALALYAEAHDAIQSASAAVNEARKAALHAAPGEASRFNFHSRDERTAFLGSLQAPERAAYLADARRLTDTDVWARIIAFTDLERLMDKTAKDEFHRQLVADPPEVTVENIFATLQHLAADADMIFRRGIAKAFSGLDRRFRSHDGFKIGSRVILSRAFDDSGYWNYHRNERDTLQDIERTFFVLDGKVQPPNYGGIVGAIEVTRRGTSGARQSETESDYFRVRCFQNGNAHIWFTRDDLVAKVNRLLAEHYGEVIGDARTDDTEEVFAPKTTPARYFGFYPTPDATADTIINEARLHRRDGDPQLRVLEPSAGTGSLARRCVTKGAAVDCIEVQPEHAAGLKAAGIYGRTTCADFLAVPPAPIYDRIVMNPPFDRERDIDHVMHALRFLKPGGFLIAIMSAGTEFRETRKSTRFRELMTERRAKWRDLPAGSFASVGTYINTLYLKVYADGREFWS
jgi:predicted RNA methylase